MRSNPSEKSFKNDLEKILGAVVRSFAHDGNTVAVSVLTLSKPTLEQTDYDNWDGGLYGYTLTLEIQEDLYRQIHQQIVTLAPDICHAFNSVTPQYHGENMQCVLITTELLDDDRWRDKARTWLTGEGITNQGRARSDNIAPRVCDGLLFRSEPEIHLYRALKSLGVTFAPLPVFVRGGQTYRRIEPDFILIKDGVVLLVEVDGDTVHRETPQEAHERLTMLLHEGVHLERVKAAECDTPEKAKACANRVLGIIQKLKTNK